MTHPDFSALPDRTGTGSLKWDRYAGQDVLPMWVADMDFPSAKPVVEALRARADHGVFGYTIPYAEVEDAVLAYLADRHGVQAEREWLFWMPGVVPALNLMCRAYAKIGEGVMTATPVYPPFLSAPQFSDRVLQAVPLQWADETWSFDWPALEKAVTSQTKVFLLCNPHNPVGRVFTREELEQVLAFGVKHDLVICSDEIHCDLILDDSEHVPMLALGEEAVKRTVTLHSPSKTYNLPGLACAYAVMPDGPLRARFKRTARGLITEVNAFGYAGCAAAYRKGEPWHQGVLEALRENWQALKEAVETRMPEVVLSPLSATYLAWLDARNLPVDCPATFFLEHGVGLSNGADFGCPGYVRLNFGCPRVRLEEALDRMEAGLKTLR